MQLLPGSLENGRSRRRRLLGACAAMLGVIVWGTLGFMWIEGWDFAKSVYFTLITVTTVGYGDEGISQAGRAFAVALLVVGIGVFSYSFAFLVQAMVASGLDWRRRMQARIDKLNRHVIVCGYGRMGRIVCRELAAGGREVVIIERHERVLQEALDDGLPALLGSAAEDETLHAAGVGRATHLVSAVDSVEESIAIALTARDLAPKLHIQARAERESEVRKLHRAGADRVISPFHAGGVEMATAVLRPKVAEFLARTAQHGGGVALGDVTVAAGSALDGRGLSDYGRNEAEKLAFVALQRPGEPVRIPPAGREVLRAGDHLIVAGDPESVVRMREHGSAPAEARDAA